jgi:superfamily II DNA/RNA helicase
MLSKNSKVWRGYLSKKNLKDYKLHPNLIKGLESQGISNLTGIQEKALEAIYKNRNISILSETGSGKTYAYGIPVINNL